MIRKFSNKEIEIIIKEYLPLINKYSLINNKIDEDLKQEILLSLIKYLKKW